MPVHDHFINVCNMDIDSGLGSDLKSTDFHLH